jgi:O-antigen/teichoic acid export membrane protein
MTGSSGNPPTPAAPGLAALQPPDALGMGRLAASGGMWAFGASVLCKVFAAASVIVMSHLLTEADYGIAGFALAVAAWLVIVSPVTMSDVAVSHRHRLERIAPLVQRFFRQSSAFSSVVLVIGTALCVALDHLSRPMVFVAMLLALGTRPCLESLLALRVAVLRIELQYRTISLIDGVANLGGVCAGIGLALLGAGPFSLLAPALLTLAIRAFAVRKVAIPPLEDDPTLRRLEAPLRRSLIRSNAAQYVHNLVFVIDAIALGLMSDTGQLGLFNFAFLVASQSNAVIGYQLGSVLQPVFVRLRGDAARESTAFGRVIRCVGAVMVPVSAMQAAVGPAVFAWLFPGRWAEALPAFMALSLAQGFYFAVHPTMAFMKSRRRFGGLLLWQVCHGVAAFVVLVPIARTGGATSVAVASSALWAVSVLTAACLAVSRRDGGRGRLLVAMLAPWATAVPAALALHWASGRWCGEMAPWLHAMVMVGAGGILGCCLILANRWTNPAAWRDISMILSGVWKKVGRIASCAGQRSGSRSLTP